VPQAFFSVVEGVPESEDEEPEDAPSEGASDADDEEDVLEAPPPVELPDE
jgi:hypothetical protein